MFKKFGIFCLNNSVVFQNIIFQNKKSISRTIASIPINMQSKVSNHIFFFLGSGNITLVRHSHTFKYLKLDA